jgi:transcriptional regulator with XRE-family HTH domain
VQQSIEDVFADDPSVASDIEDARNAAREAATFVRRMRLSAGLTQRELAVRLGISQPRVSAMEKGIGTEGPTYLMLKRVAAACGVAWSLEAGLQAADKPEKRRRSPPVGAADAIPTSRYEATLNELIDDEVIGPVLRNAGLDPQRFRTLIVETARLPGSASREEQGVEAAFEAVRKALRELQAHQSSGTVPGERAGSKSKIRGSSREQQE